ncbi:hypothetical protein BHE74_00027880 [Ensete ventricosum]|nr:hypothetical protein BHE74_00027880 [Ensete ventricosum]
MEDQVKHPTVVQKFAGQFHLRTSFSQDLHARNRSSYGPSLYGSSFTSGNYINGGFQRSTIQACSASGIPTVSSVLPVFANAPAEKGFTSFAIDFLMGGVSAAVSKTAAAPIERVKLLIQNQDELIKTGRLSEPYKGITDCFGRTIRDEGVASLWRGNTANVIRYFPTQVSSILGCYLLRTLNSVDCGAAGASSLLFVYSLDYARTRLTNDAKAAKKGGERQFNGLIDVYRKTMQSDGVAGLYRGFNISCVGIIVYRGLYFGMYDSLKPVLLTGNLQLDHGFRPFHEFQFLKFVAVLWLKIYLLLTTDPFTCQNKLQDSFFASFALGWLITNGAGLASYPIDTVRRRMMMTSGEAVKYKSSLDAFSQILKNEGAKSLFKGAGANILRAVAGAGVLAGYDKLQLIVFGKKYGSGGA